MSADHVAAIVARLNASGVVAGTKAATTYPHVIVYADAAPRSSDREADVRVTRTMTWQTSTVGLTEGQCRAALDRVTAALEDWRPIIPGRTSSKVEHPSSQPVRRDDELPDRVLYLATDQWRVASDPGA